MFCEVILSQRFPKHLGVFDYRIPDALLSQIKLGQLVTIPFRRSEYEGVVICIKKTTSFVARIKDIAKINKPEPILTPEQIKLAQWMSEYYFVSLGTIIKMMLPPTPKTKRAQKELTATEQIITPSLPVTINDFITHCLRQKKSPSLLWPFSIEQQTQFMYWLLKKIRGTVLIVVPELSDLEYYLKMLSTKKQKEVAVIHSQLNKTQFFTAWQRIITRQAEVIIGTKLALFAPLIKPELIIIDQEENQNHKQSDQNPRFDSRMVARQLAQLHHCRLLFTSHAPSVELYGDKTIHILKTAKVRKAPSLVDMRNERKAQNYLMISEKLQQAITNTLAKKSKAFLLMNKRGAASSVVCRDCGQIMKCAQCGLPLAHHTTSHEPRVTGHEPHATSFLYCHRCSRKYEIPPFCPRCSSVDFKFVGSGTQTAEQQAKKLWPQAKISRLDSDSVEIKSLPAHDIIIGTEFAFRILEWQKLGLIGVLAADTYLYLPDFRSSERTWQLLIKLSFYSNAPLIIQTYNPENKLLENIANNQPERFYEGELAERRSVGYPPFTSLAKLIYQHRDKKICLANTQKVLNYIRTSPFKPLLLTPMTPLLHGKWRMYLVIKFQSPIQDTLLRKILSSLPDGWIIDRDPVNLL